MEILVLPFSFWSLLCKIRLILQGAMVNSKVCEIKHIYNKNKISGHMIILLTLEAPLKISIMRTPTGNNEYINLASLKPHPCTQLNHKVVFS